MKHLILSFCVIVLANSVQSQTLNGVYVGAELYTTPFEGMQINNIVYYFRNDGKFNDQLNTTDWRTRISGSYRIQNNMVQLTFNNGNESKKYKLAANGNLESTAGIKHTLHKVKKVTTLPAATYERRTASTSGGIGTGMPAVGAFSSNYLYFDGKGRFSFNRTGIVGIGGDVSGGTIGGKHEQNDKTSGAYKLGDGEITLTLGNGTVSKHSFFYSPPNEEDLILLDGVFYFREEEKETVVTNQQTTSPANAQGNTSNKSELPTPNELLNKLRTNYGGENIDKITTVKETATITGNFHAVFLTDLSNNRIRAELRQGDKLLLVKQLEGNDGWQWSNGTKKSLSVDEKKELQLSLYQGILGLHKKLNNYFLTGTVSRSGNDYMLTFYMSNSKMVYLVGSDYSLKGNAYSITDAPNISVYKNFIKNNGITYSALTETRIGQNTITTNTTSIVFNPSLSANDWKTP